MTMPLTLAQLLEVRAELAPHHEAFVDGDTRLSFAEANARAASFAAYLAAEGIGRGDRVLLLAKNSEFLATALYAVSRLGAISVVGNWRLPPAELEYVARDSGSTGLLYDSAFAETAAAVTQAVPELRVRVVGIAGEGENGGRSHQVGHDDPHYRNALATGAALPAPAIVGEDGDDAIIMYTSGTTGRPKGAVLTNANMFWSGQGMLSTISWETAHRFLLVAPMFHIGGLAPLTCNVLRGTTTVFMRDFDPVQVWQTIAAERITTMMTVPLMLGAMIQVARATEVDASSLVAVTCGGAMVSRELVEAFSAFAAPVQVVYGITEFAGGLTFWTEAMGRENLDSQGKPVFGSTVAVVDVETGEPLPRGEAGELLVSGPQRFDRYWQNEEATEAALTADGWYRTGDVAYLDERGFVHLVDRVKDIIISGGENIYPAELETVLAAHSAVADVVVVGEPDERWGEVPVAHVVLHADAAAGEGGAGEGAAGEGGAGEGGAAESAAAAAAEALAAELAEHCAGQLARYKLPKRIEFIEIVPRNTLGKVLRRELRRAA
ncbi:class I adenylate-forming enzyme family protein [Leucobacter chinensis]|uniref:class I adenylate-forming enzyme family protein n=1 Tax=Leucobacter chinensis TaxID=2851010 RepID=UPI001C22AD74|nr:AMP-binding protein [Leucobacter chinensis]